MAAPRRLSSAGQLHARRCETPRSSPYAPWLLALARNTNTVLRALRLVRDEVLLELRSGHGIRVTGTPQRGAVLTKVVELVQLGRENGYTRTELARERAVIGPRRRQG
jgi:hypothetical protein